MIRFYAHQKRVIWRIIAAGSTYVAHPVGAGEDLLARRGDHGTAAFGPDFQGNESRAWTLPGAGEPAARFAPTNAELEARRNPASMFGMRETDEDADPDAGDKMLDGSA